MLGANVRRLRERLGWTQAQLAARVGCTRANLSRIEGGHNDPRHATLVRLADVLGVRIADLYAERDPETPNASPTAGVSA